AGDGAAQRSAHLGPGDRRAGMEDHVPAEARDDIGRFADIDEDRVGFLHAAQSLAIGRLDHLHFRSSDCLAAAARSMLTRMTRSMQGRPRWPVTIWGDAARRAVMGIGGGAPGEAPSKNPLPPG